MSTEDVARVWIAHVDRHHRIEDASKELLAALDEVWYLLAPKDDFADMRCSRLYAAQRALEAVLKEEIDA